MSRSSGEILHEETDHFITCDIYHNKISSDQTELLTFFKYHWLFLGYDRIYQNETELKKDLKLYSPVHLITIMLLNF